MIKPPPPDLSLSHEGRACLDGRLVQAGHHVSRGEWAAGHAIVRKLIHCAGNDGCGTKDDCHRSAMSLITEIRELIGS